jgi:hypothetical protein
MLTAIIPDPYGPDFRKEVYGDTVEQLASAMRDFIVNMGYGASDVGSQFNVYEDGSQVGLLRYNGSFTNEF